MKYAQANTLHERGEKILMTKGREATRHYLSKIVYSLSSGVFRKLELDKWGIRVDEECLSYLWFADDIVLPSEPGERQNMLEKNIFLVKMVLSYGTRYSGMFDEDLEGTRDKRFFRMLSKSSLNFPL